MVFFQRKNFVGPIMIIILALGAGTAWRLSNARTEVPANPLRAILGQSEAAAAHPVSLPALSQKQFDGRDLKVGRVLARNAVYTRYYITYKSGALTISGIMNVPKGKGPFPVLILNHGHIDTAVYTNGRGLKREQDYLARRGYVVIHPDYRNHAQSSKDPNVELGLRLGYAEDAINAVKAAQASKLSYIDGTRVGMLGHSMGGGVTLNTLVIQPNLIKAAVLFAPVSGDAALNFERWTKRRPATAQKLAEAYGSPEENPDFWHNVSASNFLDNITAPVMIHHGTADDSVPIEWSNKLSQSLKDAGKSVTYYTYPKEPHEFIKAWTQVMERTVKFFDQSVKNAK